MTTSRVIQVVIMDDEQRSAIYDLKSPKDLEAIAACLEAEAPDAVFKPYKEYVNYNTMTPDEWEDFLLEYRRKATK